MKIVVLEGSPNKKGSSNQLASCFIQGAKEAGHTVTVIDAAHANIHHAQAASTADMKDPVYKRMIWSSFEAKYWRRI